MSSNRARARDGTGAGSGAGRVPASQRVTDDIGSVTPSGLCHHETLLLARLYTVYTDRHNSNQRQRRRASSRVTVGIWPVNNRLRSLYSATVNLQKMAVKTVVRYV